jgi:cytidylate kinase
MSVIAISGLPGSGSTTVSKLLAKRLGFDHFSPGRVFKDAGKGVLQKQPYFPIFNSLCLERGINLEIPTKAHNDSEAALALWNTGLGKSKVFHEAIDELQKILATNGNIIIDGKLSLFMLPSSKLKIWLTASQSERIIRSAKRDGLILQEAQRIIPEREINEETEWKSIYSFDYKAQQSLADIVIDTTEKSPEEIVISILACIKDKL